MKLVHALEFRVHKLLYECISKLEGSFSETAKLSSNKVVFKNQVNPNFRHTEFPVPVASDSKTNWVYYIDSVFSNSTLNNNHHIVT